MIEIRSLRCGYGAVNVIDDLSLGVPRGDMVGILGPNGSGKTTLLLAMSGVIVPQAGLVAIDGTDIRDFRPCAVARRMASVQQRPEVSFGLKVLSVVLMGRYPHLDGWGDYSGEDVRMALDVLDRLGIAHLARRPINEVSGGEAQLAVIARALCQDTDILLLDEATSSLDAARKIEVFDLLTRKNMEGVTLLCVMHDLNLAALYCRRLVFLKGGRIFADGPTEDVFNDRTLSELYGTEVRVTRHPTADRPQAHFVPGEHGCYLRAAKPDSPLRSVISSRD